MGLETTLRRPIVNTRDEPHADRARWRRLHLIIGDANLLETATYLARDDEPRPVRPGEPRPFGAAAARRAAARRPGARRRDREQGPDPHRLAPARLGRASHGSRDPDGLLAVARDACRALGSSDAETLDVLARWEDVLAAAAPLDVGVRTRRRVVAVPASPRAHARARGARMGPPAARGVRPAVERRAARAWRVPAPPRGGCGRPGGRRRFGRARGRARSARHACVLPRWRHGALRGRGERGEPGTRSCSTCREPPRSSACRCWTRTAAPLSTSVRCSPRTPTTSQDSSRR